MRILSPNEIRQADEHTCRIQNIRSAQLMERAAMQFVLHFLGRHGYQENGLIVCGPGNNGGDGLAVARILFSMGLPVSVFCPTVFTSFSEDYLEMMAQLPHTLEVLSGGPTELNKALQTSAWVCDALFGVGLNRPLTGEAADLVSAINAFSGLRVSMDVPSGLREGMHPGELAVKAHWTGTFHAPKLPLLLPAFQDFCEEFEVIDIGLEERADYGSSCYYLEKKEVATLLKPRKKFSHKGTFGHALLVAGAYGKMGAAVLSVQAALHVGAGLTSWFGPICGCNIMQISVPEAMSHTGQGETEIWDVPDLDRFSAIGVGPGLGTSSETATALKLLLETCTVPLVLDADALNLISLHPNWIKHIPENSILTPHPKEFTRLAGPWQTDWEMLNKAREFSEKHRVFLVLKNAHTCMATPGGGLFFNSTGNPGMAKGGSGDVLTGMLTGFLAQGYSPEEACKLGVFLHGLAGDLAAEKFGVHSMSARHLIGEMGQAFSVLQHWQDGDGGPIHGRFDAFQRPDCHIF